MGMTNTTTTDNTATVYERIRQAEARRAAAIEAEADRQRKERAAQDEIEAAERELAQLKAAQHQQNVNQMAAQVSAMQPDIEAAQAAVVTALDAHDLAKALELRAAADDLYTRYETMIRKIVIELQDGVAGRVFSNPGISEGMRGRIIDREMNQIEDSLYKVAPLGFALVRWCGQYAPLSNAPDDRNDDRASEYRIRQGVLYALYGELYAPPRDFDPLSSWSNERRRQRI